MTRRSSSVGGSARGFRIAGSTVSSAATPKHHAASLRTIGDITKMGGVSRGRKDSDKARKAPTIDQLQRAAAIQQTGAAVRDGQLITSKDDRRSTSTNAPLPWKQDSQPERPQKDSASGQAAETKSMPNEGAGKSASKATSGGAGGATVDSSHHMMRLAGLKHLVGMVEEVDKVAHLATSTHARKGWMRAKAKAIDHVKVDQEALGGTRRH